MTREEKLNKATFDYVNQGGTTAEWSDGWEDYSDAEYIEHAFKEGAEWEHKRLVEKVCGWLENNFVCFLQGAKRGIYSNQFATVKDMVDNFKRTMEE